MQAKKKKGKESKKQPGSLYGVGIALGVGAGVALGLVFDNLPLGLAMGAGVGLTFGVALDQQRKKQD